MPIVGLGQFHLDLKRFEGLVESKLLLLQKKLVLEVLSKIVKRTPVGNPSLWQPQSLPPPKGYVGGRARANWQVGVGAAPSETVQGTDQSGGTTIAAGVSALSSAKPYMVMWVVNNLDYISALEDGHSTQAPRGMVALTIAEVNSAFGG